MSSPGDRVPHLLDDFRHARAHLSEVARVDADLGPALVHLHASPVDLPFEERAAELPQGVGGIVGRAGEHGQHRRKKRHAETGETGGALGQPGARHRAHAAGEHRRLADVGGGQPGCLGDRVEHDAFERPLAQLADDQPQQEILFLAGRARKKPRQEEPAFNGRSGAPDRCHGFEFVIDLGDRQRRGRRRLGGSRAAQQGGADADLALPQLPRQIGDGGLDLVAGKAAQRFGESGDLLQAAARLGDAAGGGDQLGKQHRWCPKLSNQQPSRFFLRHARASHDGRADGASALRRHFFLRHARAQTRASSRARARPSCTGSPGPDAARNG